MPASNFFHGSTWASSTSRSPTVMIAQPVACWVALGRFPPPNSTRLRVSLQLCVHAVDNHSPHVEALFAHVVPEPRAAELSHRSVAVLLQLHECSRSMLNVERSTCVPRQFVTGNWNNDRYTMPVGTLV